MGDLKTYSNCDTYLDASSAIAEVDVLSLPKYSDIGFFFIEPITCCVYICTLLFLRHDWS